MSRESAGKVLSVAFILCAVCSILVSLAAVGLQERQEHNKAMEKRRNILLAANLYQPGQGINEQFAAIETRLVDLTTGTFSQQFQPGSFDSRAASRDPQLSQAIAATDDVAGIKTRSRYQPVYLVMNKGELQQLVLPVYGKGLWSTMYGFIALGADLNTITGFAFYEHGETPGLGGEIDNPDWKRQWRGKKIYAPDGGIRIEVIKGSVSTTDPDADYKVDGLSGATLTSRGVQNLLRYWLGENGYEPFLEQLRKNGVNL